MFRYLFRRVALPTAAVAASAAALIWSLQAVRVLPEVLTDATPVGAALRALLLPLVPAAAFALPLAAAFGLLVAARSCRRDGTLETLASCGIGPRRIAQPFLAVGLAAGLASAALSVAAEPAALAALRDDVPVLAASAVEGRASPGEFTSVAGGIDLFVGGRDGRILSDVLVARREPGGASVEVFARSMVLRRGAAGDPEMALERGTIRRSGAGGEVDVAFDAMTLPLDLGDARGAVERLLPAGQVAPAAALIDPDALGAFGPWDRYLVLRRLAPPLQALLLAVAATGLAILRRGGAAAWSATAGGFLLAFALLRTAEPFCRDGVLSPAAAVLLPHVPLAVLAAVAVMPWGRLRYRPLTSAVRAT